MRFECYYFFNVQNYILTNKLLYKFTKTFAGTSFKHLTICLGSTGHPAIVEIAEALRFAHPGGDTPQMFNGVPLSMIAL